MFLFGCLMVISLTPNRFSGKFLSPLKMRVTNWSCEIVLFAWVYTARRWHVVCMWWNVLKLKVIQLYLLGSCGLLKDHFLNRWSESISLLFFLSPDTFPDMRNCKLLFMFILIFFSSWNAFLMQTSYYLCFLA